MSEDDSPRGQRLDEHGTEWIVRGELQLYRLAGSTEWVVVAFDDDEFRERIAARRTRIDSRRNAAVAAYAANPTDPVSAWEYIDTHPMLQRWDIDVDFGEVPIGLAIGEVWDQIEDYSLLASHGAGELDITLRRGPVGATQVECRLGPVWWPPDLAEHPDVSGALGGSASHDPELDTVASHFEAAVVALAATIRARYGDDRTRLAEHLYFVTHAQP